MKIDSDKFSRIINAVENLHQQGKITCFNLVKLMSFELTKVAIDEELMIFSSCIVLLTKRPFFFGLVTMFLVVRKPREQIADAEALLDIANTLMSSVKSQSAHGVSPAEFVNALISGFGQGSLGIDTDETAQVSLKWKVLGFAVCSTVLVSCGCSTM